MWIFELYFKAISNNNIVKKWTGTQIYFYKVDNLIVLNK